MKPSIIIFIFGFTIAFDCNSPSPVAGPVLTEQEKFYCDSLKIDSLIILEVRAQTDSIITPFPLDLGNVLNIDMDINSAGKQIPGFIFNASNINSDSIVVNLYDGFHKKGYTIFCLDRNFGIGSKYDVIGVLKTVNMYEILKQVQTNGINWEIDNDSLLNLIRKFDKKYSLQLIGASGDWCEFKISKAPLDWRILATEAYKVCPDIVDQGPGTVEKLAVEMEQTKRLYFWWD